MLTTLKYLLAMGALAAMPAQAAAQAAKPCLSEAEVRALATFAMPSALGGLIQHCGPHVGGDGFMRTGGAALVAGYAARKDSAWPVARRAFFRLADDGKDKATADLMARMPDAALQPFVEGLIGGLIGEKLKPGQCVLADKIMRLLAPLPPENTIELLGTIVALTGDGPRKGAGFPVCKS